MSRYVAVRDIKYGTFLPDARIDQGHREPSEKSSIARIKNNLNTRVREYVNSTSADDSSPSWLSKREIPSSLEIRGEDENAQTGEDIEIPVNRVHAPWDSKEMYLEHHYRLLREDAISPLRDAVAEVRVAPYMYEADSVEDAAIYDKVFIVGFTLANTGIAARIAFSMERVRKRIIWEQSKRLAAGTIVALTTKEDHFRKICLVAVVAARTLAGLELNPPEIDVFFATPDEIELDPQQEWLMVESRNGFFESHRHILTALQKMSKERFPLTNYIINLSRNIEAPDYLAQQPFKDLSHIFRSGSKDFRNVDVLQDWPEDAESDMDASQLAALQCMLTKSLAIVQGPPGTGKTFVSVKALHTLQTNMRPGDPPILVASHTNHALDQLLRHVQTFDEEFIRLGGFTTDLEHIKPRTMYEVKQAVKKPDIPGGARMPALAQMRRLNKEIGELLKPLTVGGGEDEPIKSNVFVQYGILTEAQRESLIKGASEWRRSDQPDGSMNEFTVWLGPDMIPFSRPSVMPLHDFEVEEMDLEFEQLKEMEAETKIEDEEEINVLHGHALRIGEPFTCKPKANVTEDRIQMQLDEQDMWKIHQKYRGPIYRWMCQSLKLKLRDALRHKSRQHSAIAKQLKIGRWEIESNFLDQAKIVGMTTTGLSKYRGLLQSVQPKIVMIEEAAETLEAFVTAACMDSVEHIILVGDHQQLRGHCSVQDLEGYPWFLDVSMFERLVRHSIGHTQLKSQRRMIPEICRILMPIYPDLENHPSVLTRVPVPGMGGINSYLFVHNWLEDTDSQNSKVNIEEARMVSVFYNYLIDAGLSTKDITVLTFYNGQRKLILRLLRCNPSLQGPFKVVTVDSYQGEENAIVLLSLVRNNRNANIGFLSIINRVCVALSRAQRGFYIFGNAELLCHTNLKWFQIVQAMANEPRRVGYQLPITCDQHQNQEFKTNPMEFKGLNGGCSLPCSEQLPCGHLCRLSCHPFPHSEVICKQQCTRQLDCGHHCQEQCFLPCRCENCSNEPAPRDIGATTITLPPKPPGSSHSRSPPKSPHSRSQSHSQLRRARTGSQPETRQGTPFSQMSQKEITDQIEAYQGFASGGHVKADKKAIEAANKEVALAIDEDTRKKLDEADAEMAAALFGDIKLVDTSTSPAKTPRKKENVALVGRSGDGHRNVWKGTYNPFGTSDDSHKAKGEEKSLLD